MNAARSNVPLFAFATIMAVAAFLRFYDNNASLFADEILTYKGASLPLDKVITYKIYPLYYTIGHFFLELGQAELFIRLPSILAGLALVGLAYAAGRSLHGVWTGILFALVLALLDYHVVQSRNARYYALMMLLAFGGLWYLAAALRNGGWWRWTLFGVLTGLSFLTQVCAIPFMGSAIFGAAVFILASPGPSLPAGKWRMLVALALSSFIAVSGVGALIVSLEQYPTDLVSFSLDDEDDGTNTRPAKAQADADAPPKPAPKPEKTYRLSLSEYGGYLTEYLLRAGTISGRAERGRVEPWLLGLGVALLLAGLVHLAVRHRALAAVAAAALIVTPVPFLLIESTHFFHSRYFSPQVPVLALLAVMGVTGVASLIRHLLPKRDAEESGEAFAPRDYVYAAVCVVLFAPYFVALADESHWRVTRGFDLFRGGEWKEAIPYMMQTMSPEDVVVHAVDGGPARGQMAQHNAFYYHRYLPNPWRYFNEQQRVASIPQPGDIEELMTTAPDRTIWVMNVYPSMMPDSAIEELARWNPTYREFKRLRVWTVGKPTVNLFPMGDFEGDDALRYFGPFDKERSYGLVGGDTVYDGAASLYLEQDTDDMVRAFIPLLPSFRPLRNASFDVWDDTGAPIGWQVTGPGDNNGISKSEGTRPGSGAVSLDSTGGAVALAQPMPQWRAGMAIALRLWARAPDDRLSLTVEYTIRGSRHRESARHSGEDRWEAIELNYTLPLDADPGSAVLRITAEQRPAGVAVVDDFQFNVGAVAQALNPDKLYTLSFMVRQSRIPEFDGRGMILVSSFFPGRSPVNRVVHSFRGDTDWTFVSVPIVPGRDTLEGAAELAIGFGLNQRGSRLWIDNMQFEESPSATPFVRGVRMPHDEVGHAAADD